MTMGANPWIQEATESNLLPESSGAIHASPSSGGLLGYLVCSLPSIKPHFRKLAQEMRGAFLLIKVDTEAKPLSSQTITN